MNSLQLLPLQATQQCPNSPNLSFSPFQGFHKCSSMKELRQYHSITIRLGLSTDNYTMGGLIKFSALSPQGDLTYALKLFDSLPEPDTFIYNTIIQAYLKSHSPTTCILLYLHMLLHSVPPNNFTFPSLIRACCVNNDIAEGRQIHAHVLKFGFGGHVVSVNNLLYMYLNFQALQDARKLFDQAPDKDFVSWTTLISGYSCRGLVDEAFEVFQLMPNRNSAAWNAMIAAFVQCNRFHEAFALFDSMRLDEVELDKFVAASMLSACTGLGALEQGKWIHAFIEKNGIEVDSKLATTIIDMYCKCGSWEKAFNFFNGLRCKEISSWNSMIGGLAMHGKGHAAVEVFKEMERQMVAPDNITFLNLLGACAHSGLVNKGRYYFTHMIEVHGIEPRTEHFCCMVDLLGRAGMLEEAKRLIDEMPMSPDAAILGALLAACKNHRNIELGEQIGRILIELEPNNSGRYVLFANLYASVGRWEDVANVRKLMDERRVKKAPGFSMIEVGGTVNEFTAGGMDHPQAKEICAKVDEMLECIKCIGYFPNTDAVVHDLDEEERENPLHYHSEKLAVAFGLLRTKPGETLRISKNLRICKDCHQASKLISKVYDREIIIRDRNRFHHFTKGECSCKDYW